MWLSLFVGSTVSLLFTTEANGLQAWRRFPYKGFNISKGGTVGCGPQTTFFLTSASRSLPVNCYPPIVPPRRLLPILRSFCLGRTAGKATQACTGGVIQRLSTTSGDIPPDTQNSIEACKLQQATLSTSNSQAVGVRHPCASAKCGGTCSR